MYERGGNKSHLGILGSAFRNLCLEDLLSSMRVSLEDDIRIARLPWNHSLLSGSQDSRDIAQKLLGTSGPRKSVWVPAGSALRALWRQLCHVKDPQS